MRDCCCPQYTIRLDATKFQASKSQRKLISRFNRYIEGTYNPFDKDDVSDVDNTDNNKAKQQQSNKKPTKTFDIIESIHESEKIEGKHRFKIVLEKSSFTKEKYQLYFKYQTNVHDDKEYEVSESGFRRFLYEPSSKPNTPGYGSFHQCYYLDDKLIAVAVLDILPSCISSVYFFYDNDYSAMQLDQHLTKFINDINKDFPNLSNFQQTSYSNYSCQPQSHFNSSIPNLFVASDVTKNSKLIIPFIKVFPCLYMLSDFYPFLEPYRTLKNPIDNKILYKFLLPLTDLMVAARASNIYSVHAIIIRVVRGQTPNKPPEFHELGDTGWNKKY
ncbi:10129_t:CDS:2 [Entrophospora sp. SA101]|nr:10129_t:CDS:2 [Entrophospora sp. SA101]